jgi:hypothetical protein
MGIALFSNTSGSQTETKTTPNVLSREVTNYSDSGTDIAQPLFRASEKFRIPIGVELDGLQPTQTISVKLSRGTVTDLLNAIVGPSSGLQWKESNGVVNVMPVQNSNSILDLKVAHFRLKDISVGDIREAITAQPEIKAWLTLNRVSERSLIVTSGQHPDRQRLSIELKGVTLREIMNAIVKLPGMHEWSFVRYGKNREYLNIGIA